jgi:hypothetical protein
MVQFFGATQAQDYLFAKWSLAQRLVGATDLALEQAFSAGAFLRTHVLRPTWFFVHPDDIRWMLALTAPRVHQLNALYYRKEGIDDGVKRASMRLIEQALTTRADLTRDELYAHLRDANLVGETPKLRGVYILMHAELEGLICSGPMRGKQQTYALLEDRAPEATRRTREESVIELARRYFISHGPATRKDFARWSGLTLADTDSALDALATELESEQSDDETLFFSPVQATVPVFSNHPVQAFLVSGYDEYLNGYASWSHATERATLNRTNPDSYLLRNQMAIVDGQIVGVWGREVHSKVVTVEINPFFPLADLEADALERSAQAFGDYSQRTIDLKIVPFAAR